MAKKCIFCGEPISEKSREHVIPQWLIEMTGEKKRIAAIGIDYSEIILRYLKEDRKVKRLNIGSIHFYSLPFLPVKDAMKHMALHWK
ncbi:MAG: hypothetical protein E7470_08950 [Ruminococcaceae bacterium]|nr:hypothetical protein [Oscillospiraceae bacterium]